MWASSKFLYTLLKPNQVNNSILVHEFLGWFGFFTQFYGQLPFYCGYNIPTILNDLLKYSMASPTWWRQCLLTLFPNYSNHLSHCLYCYLLLMLQQKQNTRTKPQLHDQQVTIQPTPSHLSLQIYWRGRAISPSPRLRILEKKKNCNKADTVYFMTAIALSILLAAFNAIKQYRLFTVVLVLSILIRRK